MAGYALGRGKRWGLLVGVAGYLPARGFTPLPAAASDLRSLAGILCDGPSPFTLRILGERGGPDAQPTLANIKAALRQLARAAGPEDLVLFYFSGHGLPVSGTTGLVPLDGHLEAPHDTLLHLSDVLAILAGSAAPACLTVIDACHAAPPGKGLALEPTEGLRSPAPTASGHALLTASRRGEIAAMLPDGTASLFTHFLVEGLAGAAAGEDGIVTLARLFSHVSDRVRVHAFASGGLLQTPVLIGRMEGEVQLRQASALPRPKAPSRRAQDDAALIGRTRDLDTVEALLTRHRLVTITGLGGMGKTSLAREIARRAAPTLHDRVWWADLAGWTGPGDLGARVLSALGVPPIPGQPPLTRAMAHLGDAPGLIVLDACEGAREEVARLAEMLLGRCARLRILATSRAGLDAAPEKVLRLSPLTLGRADTAGDAERLFLARAAAVGPELAQGDEVLAKVRRICAASDGIPLAIELLAARLRVLPLAEVDARASAPLRLASGGKGRHSSLRDVIAESVELLPPPARRLYPLLGVFVGSFDLEAADGILGGVDPREEILDALVALDDHALLEVHRGGERARFKLLDTLREWAEGELARAGDRARWDQRHGAFYLERWQARQAEWDDWDGSPREAFQRDGPELLAALERAKARGDGEQVGRIATVLYAPLIQAGEMARLSAALEAARTLSDAQSPATRWEVAHSWCMVRWRLGDLAQARSVGEEALRDPLIGSAPLHAGRLHQVLGQVLAASGDHHGALIHLDQAAQALDRAGDLRALARTHTLRAFALKVSQRLTDALEANALAVEAWRGAGAEGPLATVLLGRAHLFVLAGDLAKADEALTVAEAAAARLRDARRAAIACSIRGALLVQRERPWEAVALMEATRPLILADGAPDNVSFFLEAAAQRLAQAGEAQAALAMLRLASGVQAGFGHVRTPVGRADLAAVFVGAAGFEAALAAPALPVQEAGRVAGEILQEVLARRVGR